MLYPLRVPNAYCYSQPLPEAPGIANAFFFATDEGNVLVDPLPLDDRTSRQIAELGGTSRIIAITANRKPIAEEIAARDGAVVIANPQHREPIAPGMLAIRLEHQRRDGEFAVNLPDNRTVVVGDSLVGAPAGSLSMPAGAYPDAQKAALGLRRILRENPETLLLSHGQSIFGNAYDALYRLLYATAGAEVHRINVDELDFRDERDERDQQPKRYQCIDAEVGFAIGARGLGYRVSTLEPGHAFCPLHGHEREEELFFVIDGEPSVRTLSGTIRCRKGDFIALPVGESGTHQLLNESAAPATVMLLARTEPFEACYYPDSDKLLVDTPAPLIPGRDGVLVSASPELDYFDGEG